jgi:hypothetical protein
MEMTLPGFSADDSLYRNKRQYTATLSRGSIAHGLAAPQAGGGCYYAFGSWHTCTGSYRCCRYPNGCVCFPGSCPASHLVVVGTALNRPRLYNFSFHVCRGKSGAGFSVPSTTQIDLSRRHWAFRTGALRQSKKKAPWRGELL